jgi:OOP family OmpA-OmpF porin
MQRLATVIAGLAGAALLTAGSTAAAQSGWYAGIAFGSSNARTDTDVVAVTGATSARLVSDQRDPGVKALAGYRFNRHFALEAGYAWLGEFQYTNQISAPSAGALNADVRMIGLFADAVGLLPIGAGVTALAKVGVVGSETRVFRSISGTVTPAPQSPTNAINDGANLKYGLGVQVDVGKVATVRLEWERFVGLGATDTGEFDVDVYFLGLLFRF